MLIVSSCCAALELLVSNSVTGMPVLDDDGVVVGVVSDYDLLSLEGIAEQVSMHITSWKCQVKAVCAPLAWLLTMLMSSDCAAR